MTVNVWRLGSKQIFLPSISLFAQSLWESALGGLWGLGALFSVVVSWRFPLIRSTICSGEYTFSTGRGCVFTNFLYWGCKWYLPIPCCPCTISTRLYDCRWFSAKIMQSSGDSLHSAAVWVHGSVILIGCLWYHCKGDTHQVVQWPIVQLIEYQDGCDWYSNQRMEHSTSVSYKLTCYCIPLL